MSIVSILGTSVSKRREHIRTFLRMNRITDEKTRPFGVTASALCRTPSSCLVRSARLCTNPDVTQIYHCKQGLFHFDAMFQPRVSSASSAARLRSSVAPREFGRWISTLRTVTRTTAAFTGPSSPKGTSPSSATRTSLTRPGPFVSRLSDRGPEGSYVRDKQSIQRR